MLHDDDGIWTLDGQPEWNWQDAYARAVDAVAADLEWASLLRDIGGES